MEHRNTFSNAVLVDSIHVLPAVEPTNLPPMITSVSPVSGTVGASRSSNWTSG